MIKVGDIRFDEGVLIGYKPKTEIVGAPLLGNKKFYKIILYFNTEGIEKQYFDSEEERDKEIEKLDKIYIKT